MALERRGEREMGEMGSEQGGQVEGGEDGEAVAEGEEQVGETGDGCRRFGRGIEHARELGVLVHAEGEVHGGGGEEFCGAGGDGRGGRGGDGRGEGVHGVGGEVGAEVEGKDEEEGPGCEEAVGGRVEGAEAVEKELAEGLVGGGF